MTVPLASSGAPEPPLEADPAEQSSQETPEHGPIQQRDVEAEGAAETGLPPEDSTAVEAGPSRSAGFPDWRYAPTPTAAPTIGTVLAMPPPQLAAVTSHRQASVSLDGLFIGPYHVAAGSIAGSAHLASGVPRQDAYDFIVAESGRLVIAVADGMGSRPHSQLGATAFCDGICLAAAARPDDTALGYLAWANDYAVKVGSDHQLSPDDVSYVAAVAVFDGDSCEILRVGDISAFALTDEGFSELFDGQDGHVNIVTTSLPAQPLPPPESFCGTGTPQIVLCTDGLANDIRNSAQVRAWLQECWGHLVDAYGMAEALRFRRRGSHDDRTAVLVSVKTPDETGESNGRAAGSELGN
jgi:serine/threonine protein phosphatase PrpC